jgi:hypothetical protein
VVSKVHAMELKEQERKYGSRYWLLAWRKW